MRTENIEVVFHLSGAHQHTEFTKSSMMMERILLSALCLSGWVIFSTCLLHQYHFVSERMNWTEAQTYCREKYIDLATIESTEEMNQLISTVSSAGHSSEVWIGLYSKIVWRWSDGYTGRGYEYRKWVNNEPDFHYDQEFCVCTGTVNDPWWDDDCRIKYPIICNNGTQLNPEFVIVNQNLNWSSGQRYCRENFRDMATVTNSSQSLEIQKMVPERWAWIGLFRDPNIYWSDGSAYSFSYWYIGRNTLGPNSVVCGVAALQSSGKWKFFPCETSLPFVCYSGPPPAPVKRQIFKVKIRRDSSVDLNDPAVQADILKKFEDRLKEKGVSGVTLKWRKQSDGKVFHKEEKTSQKKKRNKTEL